MNKLIMVTLKGASYHNLPLNEFIGIFDSTELAIESCLETIEKNYPKLRVPIDFTKSGNIVKVCVDFRNNIRYYVFELKEIEINVVYGV